MKLNVAVLFGGRSTEHEISVISAAQVIQAIDPNKYHVIPIYITKQGAWFTGDKLLSIQNFSDTDKLLTTTTQVLLPQHAENQALLKDSRGLFGTKLLGKIDVAFPVFHGTHGEDGAMQGFFELLNIPYVGCNVLASATTMDKVVTKMLLRELDIPVLDHVWFYSHEWMKEPQKLMTKIEKTFSYPLIVKPADLGSSVGVSSVKNKAALEEAIDLVISMSQRVIVEPKITNLKEVNCSVLGDHEHCEASICEEPIQIDEILSYKNKYMGGSKSPGKIPGTKGTKSAGMSGLKRKIPADIPEKTAQKIQELAKQAFVGLNCSGVVRIDFLIDQNKKDNNIYLCEINSIPGSLSFYLWEHIGVPFDELTDRLIQLALKRHREKNSLNFSFETNILKGFK
ncbi:MAG: D-alanine--D-alanine ligase [Gammaproteobacteria bacterium]|nr:D-alanine--D-alanine ligase [Gammaproteobacteria bacterium]